MRHRFLSLLRSPFRGRVATLLISLWLVACSNDAKPTFPQRRAARGEPCLVLNDCKEPLLCLSGRCLDAKPPVAANNNQCVVGSCLSDEDCCPPLPRFRAEVCDALAARCDKGDSFACQDYSTDCVCTSACKNYQCSARPGPAECQKDSECGFGNVCHEGHCAACAFDVNCSEGLICLDERCQPPCKHDGHCGALESCDANGRCQTRGCVSDLECIALLGVRDAQCKGDECVVPCTSDAACPGFGFDRSGLGTCREGVCRDLGCEQDADCEARLRLPDRSIALCLPAEEAKTVRPPVAPAGSFE